MQSSIQTHVAILQAFDEIEGNHEAILRMKQWLLRQKLTKDWGSVPSTVDAIFALVMTDSIALEAGEQLQVKVNRKAVPSDMPTNEWGYLKQSYAGSQIPSRVAEVTIRKQTNQLSWGGLYLQYIEPLENVKSHEGGLAVEKELYVEREGRWIPVFSGGAQQSLKVGDKINVRLVVQVPEEMQYVHLKDLRAGCFEPTAQLSGMQWRGNVLYYQETDDVVTNLFFEFLPKGTHVFEYTVWIARSGAYQDGIATLQGVYAPQFSANSDAKKVKIKE